MSSLYNISLPHEAYWDEKDTRTCSHGARTSCYLNTCPMITTRGRQRTTVIMRSRTRSRYGKLQVAFRKVSYSRM
eukprot:6357186-Amphidinium_carterae.1